MKQKDGMVVALLGVIAGLLIVFIFQLQGAPSATGQTGGVKGDKWIMATSVSQNSAVCFLFDTEAQRLGAYSVMAGGNQFDLVGTRTVNLEFGVREYGKNVRPPYKQLKDEIDKANAAGKGGEKGK